VTSSATTAVVSHRRRHSCGPLTVASSALILLVERELASRLSSANELLDEGYDIVESENASEAMSILRGRNDFDAMIADIDAEHAPGGLALIRYAASHHPSMKILVRSAGIEVQAESDGIDADFLPKPCPVGGLVQCMRDLLEQSALAHQPTPAPLLVS
jgi:DNA-binding NtrC family response regulator